MGTQGENADHRINGIMEELEHVGNNHYYPKGHQVKIVSGYLPWEHEGQALCLVPQTTETAFEREKASAHLGWIARASLKNRNGLH